MTCFDNRLLTATATLSVSSACSRSALPIGPTPKASFKVCSRSPPPIPASNGLIVTEPNPASASIERTRLGSAKANGPGATGSGGATGGRNGSAACSGACIHGFSSRGRQQTKARRPPPGFNDARTLVNAATGSLKNITPKRENAASKRPCPRAPVCASSFRKATCKSGAERGRRRATSSMGSEISTPKTKPVGRTRAARASEVWPHPQPMSMTCSPSSSASTSMAARPNGSI